MCQLRTRVGWWLSYRARNVCSVGVSRGKRASTGWGSMPTRGEWKCPTTSRPGWVPGCTSPAGSTYHSNPLRRASMRRNSASVPRWTKPGRIASRLTPPSSMRVAGRAGEAVLAEDLACDLGVGELLPGPRHRLQVHQAGGVQARQHEVGVRHPVASDHRLDGRDVPVEDGRRHGRIVVGRLEAQRDADPAEQPERRDAALGGERPVLQGVPVARAGPVPDRAEVEHDAGRRGLVGPLLDLEGEDRPRERLDGHAVEPQLEERRSRRHDGRTWDVEGAARLDEPLGRQRGVGVGDPPVQVGVPEVRRGEHVEPVGQLGDVPAHRRRTGPHPRDEQLDVRVDAVGPPRRRGAMPGPSSYRDQRLPDGVGDGRRRRLTPTQRPVRRRHAA